MITVAAVSFQMHSNPNDAGMMSVFLFLLGVTHHTTAHPPSITSWRRNGVGLFMLIQVIKRCASIDNVTRIKVFLQCSEPSAFHFYTMIGFRQINKSDTDDGFEMLPEHIRTGLEKQEPSPFLRFPSREPNQSQRALKAPILMRLRHCGLKHVTALKPSSNPKDTNLETEVAPREVPYWCQYPPPRLVGGGRLVYWQKDADSLFAQLPLLRKLFPVSAAFGFLETQR